MCGPAPPISPANPEKQGRPSLRQLITGTLGSPAQIGGNPAEPQTHELNECLSVKATKFRGGLLHSSSILIH